MENTRTDHKGLTILFVPNNGFENMPSLKVLADELQERGHRTVFAVNMASKGLITYKDLTDSPNAGPRDYCALNPDINFDVFRLSPIEVLKKFNVKYLWNRLTEIKERELYFEILIERIKPDVIVVESMLCSPIITNCGIPWVWINFGAPNLYFDYKCIPPAWSGLPLKSKRDKWLEFGKQKSDIFQKLHKDLNDWCLLRGAPPLPPNQLHPHSPHLNIYIYPQALDYTLGKSFPPDKWYRFNSLIKSNTDTSSLDIPGPLLARPGKLIYLSMDSYGSADVDLMKRLTTILSQSDNKFIASLGPFHSKYELPDNFWGLEDLPQSEAIKAADLVITCGDTKTVTEVMFYGKPMIVMPLFGHQLDNAQRVREMGFGVILEPYGCQISTTFGSIAAMLGDVSARRRLSHISYKMQNSCDSKTICRLIEGLTE